MKNPFVTNGYVSPEYFCDREKETAKYAEFCCKHFERASKRLNTSVIIELYERFNGITSYMQKVMNILFSTTGTGEICIPSM